MDLTVVIRCGDDKRVFRCINSIDEEVEIIVALNKNEKLQKQLEKKGVKYCLTPPNNLSIVSNLGVESSSYEKVIITDSDTWFKKGAIRKVYHALDKYPVINMKLIFKDSAKVPMSSIVAKARDYVNSLPVIYTPGIGIKKSIIPLIGGFLFDASVPYAVDANLTYRIKKRHIKFLCLKDAVVYHDAETLKHDLKAAYRIGKGCMISAKRLFYQNFDDNIIRILYSLKGVKPKHWIELIRKKGGTVFIYQLIWDFFFYLGAIFQGIFNK